MRRYRKKPVEVEAVQWTGSNEAELVDFAGRLFMTVHPDDRVDDPEQTAAVFDELHNTWARVYTGQWVIKGVKGEFYPCAGDVFAETYESISGAGAPTVNVLRSSFGCPTCGRVA